MILDALEVITVIGPELKFRTYNRYNPRAILTEHIIRTYNRYNLRAILTEHITRTYNRYNPFTLWTELIRSRIIKV